MSTIIVMAAQTGSGKSTWAREIFEAFPEKHWAALDPKHQFTSDKRIHQINPNTNLKISLPTIKNSVVCIDEAPIHFPLAATNPEIVNMLLSCRHNFTIVVLNFHAVQQIPIYIRNYINILILGKTNDDIKQAGKFGRKSEEIYKAMDEIYLSTDLHERRDIYF